MNELKVVPMFKFRVLVDFHPDYKVFVARCLETGNTATSDDVETAQGMILELLEDEIEFAIKHENIRNLTSSPAPIDVWSLWVRAVKDGAQIIKKEFAHGEICTQLSMVVRISHQSETASKEYRKGVK